MLKHIARKSKSLGKRFRDAAAVMTVFAIGMLLLAGLPLYAFFSDYIKYDLSLTMKLPVPVWRKEYLSYNSENKFIPGDADSYVELPYTGYYYIEVWGADGGDGATGYDTHGGLSDTQYATGGKGGKGGLVRGVYHFQQGTKLTLQIGGSGESFDSTDLNRQRIPGTGGSAVGTVLFGAGGSGGWGGSAQTSTTSYDNRGRGGGGGGGASGVLLGDKDLVNLIIVAGGGGGGGGAGARRVNGGGAGSDAGTGNVTTEDDIGDEGFPGTNGTMSNPVAYHGGGGGGGGGGGYYYGGAGGSGGGSGDGTVGAGTNGKWAGGGEGGGGGQNFITGNTSSAYTPVNSEKPEYGLGDGAIVITFLGW